MKRYFDDFAEADHTHTAHIAHINYVMQGRHITPLIHSE